MVTAFGKSNTSLRFSNSGSNLLGGNGELYAQFYESQQEMTYTHECIENEHFRFNILRKISR